ncbi:MAG: bifunctional 3-demethylubiquinol 3-O-methyltransferase/2-polyprenyl-6-hydroxyphenol methylase, partial [Desulfatitalea sp.]
IFFATVNRTPLAGLLVILAAEYLLGIVRKGTHRYAKFVRPQELIAWGAAAGLNVAGLTGLRYLPFVGHARLCRSLVMNYMVHFKRR